MSATTTNRPQCLDALDKANEVRFHRADVKRAIREGRTTVPDVLLGELHPLMEGMRILDLLTAQPYWGLRKSRPVLAELRIGERRTLGSLTLRQRALIADAMMGRRDT